MAKISFRSTNFRAESRKKIEAMISIVAEYERGGYRLTARQLYYQFVSRNIIPNTERSYKSLTSLLTDARYAGLIDWNAIEDRGREAVVWAEYPNVASLVERSILGYRRPRWDDQPAYAELWVEKQALAGVLQPLAAEFHVALMVNKGYSSASAMFAAAQRFLRRQRRGKKLHLFYLGDHDPSGEDMVRDIADRLAEFGLNSLTVHKVALTMAQIEEHDPPPNPAKTTDSRYEAYSREHGEQSWEVDALPPDVLERLIRDHLSAILDESLWESVIEQEERDKSRLRDAVSRLGEE